MKQFLYSVMVMMAGITCISSCKNKLVEPPDKSITEIMATYTDYSILNAALERTGYNTLLSTSPSVTLFAPNDAAFIALGYTLDSIKAMNITLLDSLIGYHLVGEALTTSNITALSTLETLSGKYLYTSHTTLFGSRVNAMDISDTYVAAANGIIHLIPKVLVAPAKTLQDYIASDTAFSFLQAIITRDSIKTFASTSTLFTLFAPVNNAFRKLGVASADALKAAVDGDSALIVINHHYLSGLLYQTGDFVYETELTTPSDSLLILNTSANPNNATLGVYAQNLPNTVFVPLLSKDSFATNGIIHRVETLFLPKQ